MNIDALQKQDVTVDGKKYSLLIGYQNHEAYRAAFDKLTQDVFNLSFELWYSLGYWNEKYIPYTLFDGMKAVANASVNVMDFNVLGELKRYIQVGTVATDKQYRNRGLSRFLMKQIMSEWHNRCEFIYLFANHTVLDFYPKLGFKRVKEYGHFKKLSKHPTHVTFEKMDMNLSINQERLYQYAKNSNVFGKLSLQKPADVVMFYAVTAMKDHVYYSEALDTFVFAIFEDKQLHLMDIFTPHAVELNEIISGMFPFESGEVMLGFTPIDAHEFQVKEINGDDVLFIQEDKMNPFEGNRLMFPLLSHA